MRILALLSLLALTGCVTQKKCLQKFPPETVTVVRVVEKETVIYRDTTIYVELPEKVVEVEKYIEVPIDFKSDTVFAYGEYSKAYAFVSMRKLRVRLHEGGELKVNLENALKEITRLRHEVKKEVVTHVVTEYRTRWYMKGLAIVGLASMIIIGVMLLFRFK
jgi:hypothetical protein